MSPRAMPCSTFFSRSSPGKVTNTGSSPRSLSICRVTSAMRLTVGLISEGISSTGRHMHPVPPSSHPTSWLWSISGISPLKATILAFSLTWPCHRRATERTERGAYIAGTRPLMALAIRFAWFRVEGTSGANVSKNERREGTDASSSSCSFPRPALCSTRANEPRRYPRDARGWFPPGTLTMGWEFFIASSSSFPPEVTAATRHPRRMASWYWSRLSVVLPE
ncbi:hypothetical protein DSECCO2_276190 [anaerobic digester metagenome]